MKILYLDFLYPEGHNRLDRNNINRISEIGKIYVLSPRGRYKDVPNEIELIEKDSLEIRSGKLLSRLSSLKIMIISALLAIKIKPDYIYITSYETIMFALGRLFLPKKKRIFLVHHNNIDELKNKLKRNLFITYMNKVEHIVFEDFIKDYLMKEFNLESNKVHVLPHHMHKNIGNHSQKVTYTCVGLSNSNDENVISEIIDREKREEILKNKNHKVILKSKDLEFDNGFLKVIKGFIDNEKFEDYINNSKCIYIPFPLKYNYRMSGTLVDAFSNNKILLGSNIKLVENYSIKYPEICKVINDTEDFFNHITNMDLALTDAQIKDFGQFKINHSNIRIEEIFKMIFKI